MNTVMPSNLIPFYKKELEAVKDNLQADKLNYTTIHYLFSKTSIVTHLNLTFGIELKK